MAAPTVTVLAQGNNETPGTTFATASISPSANKLIVIVLAFRSFNTSAFFPTTTTGCGISWKNHSSAFIANSNAARVMTIIGTSDAPTAGAVTFDWGFTGQSVAAWAILEFDGAFPAGGPNLSLALLQDVALSSQTGVSGSIGMGTFKNADSGTLGIFGLLANLGVTPDVNFTEIAEQSPTTPALTLEVEYQEANDNSIDPSWGSSASWCGLGIEVPAAPTMPNDDLANATVLSTTLPGSLTNQITWGATQEAGEPELGNQDQSVWYKFTPASSGYYRFLFTNIFAAQNDPTFNFGSLGVEMRRTTTLGDFVQSFTDRENFVGNGGSNPSGPPPASFQKGNDIEIIAKLQAGQTYTFKVYSNRNSSSDQFNSQTCIFDMSWDTFTVTPPANDDFDDAEIVGASIPDTFSGTTVDSTQEEGEPHTQVQSVWFKFTPATTAQYKITAPAASIVGHPSSGTLAWANLYVYDGTGVSSPADIGSQIGSSLLIDADATEDEYITPTLTAGTTYYFYVSSDLNLSSGAFNHRVIDFDIEIDIIVPPDNDDFADATLISGASGSEDFTTVGSSFETAGSEPVSGYYNDPQTQGTVWFEWVCPATGDYKFEVETLEDPGTTQVTYDLAIWTGAALNALTRIVRNWAGEEPLLTTQKGAGTAVGFHAISGTTYWIQIANWQPIQGNNSRLTWDANTVTGNTTGAADNFVVGRINNHGNDDTEPPPDFVSRLSGHDSWWFTDGQVGKCKWFKFVATEDRTININGHMWDGFPETGVGRTLSDMGLLAYKGADYASLTPASTSAAQGSADLAMMLETFPFAESQSWASRLTTIAGTGTGIVHPEVEMLTGEILWVCVFGLYDADYIGSGPEDAAEFELDVVFGDPPAANDNLLNFIDITGNNQVHASSIAGTTAGCTEQSSEGELAHGGFGPERSVWYKILTPWQGGDIRIWVESAGDCVLSVYSGPFTGLSAFWQLTSIAEDDDSGAGNWPEVTIADDDGNNPLYICVDSKADTDFVLKYQRLSSGTPPANDDFANAEVHVGAFTAAGTTVGGTGEPEETFLSDWEGAGATDGVWYKYTADHTGTTIIRGVCLSEYIDGYVFVHVFQGTGLDDLTLISSETENPPGEFYFGNDADENDPLLIDVVNGQDYYIRVATWSGGSEDFEIYVDAQQVYVNITPSGSDEMHGTLIDSAEVYVNITADGSDDYHVGNVVDSATVPIKITISSNEFKGHDYIDADTVRVALTIDSHDCQTLFDPNQLTAYCHRRLESRAYSRWLGTQAYRRFEVIAGDGLEEC